jgi:hypothetical protein
VFTCDTRTALIVQRLKVLDCTRIHSMAKSSQGHMGCSVEGNNSFL